MKIIFLFNFIVKKKNYMYFVNNKVHMVSFKMKKMVNKDVNFLKYEGIKLIYKKKCNNKI